MSLVLPEYLKSAVEAILFVSEKPVTVDQLREVIEDVGAAEIKTVLSQLTQEYEDNRRGMTIQEIAGGYQLLSSPYYAEYIRNFFKVRVKEKLSRPSLETLAIVAYKQPVSRGDIELIRGVNSDGVVVHLLDKGLIKIVGRKDIPGRPYLYGTTKLFLEYFGLKSLEDMPKLEEVSALITSGEQEAAILPVTDAEAQAEQQALQSQVQAKEDQLAGAAGQPSVAGDALAQVPEGTDAFPRQQETDASAEQAAELKVAIEGMNKPEDSPAETNADRIAGRE